LHSNIKRVLIWTWNDCFPFLLQHLLGSIF
jgi:hypothetical protein